MLVDQPPARHLVRARDLADRRYADALRAQVSAVLAPSGLRLAPKKTAVVHIDEGFDFLGFHIRRMRKPGTNKYHV